MFVSCILIYKNSRVPKSENNKFKIRFELFKLKKIIKILPLTFK